MENIPVRARDCACPDTPHEEGDIVYLLPKPSLALGLAAQSDVIKALDDAAVLQQRWLVTYLTHGAVGWNLTDEKGPVPFDVQVLLADFSFAMPVAEKADELYGDAVMNPLALRLSAILRNGQTAVSTSPRVRSTRKRPSRSSRPATAVSTR